MLSSRRDVDKTEKETGGADNDRNHPSFPVGKSVTNDGNDATGQRDGTTDSKGEQHEEEEYGKQLRYNVKLGNRFRIGNESQSGSALNDSFNRFARFVSQIAQNGENGDASQQTRKSIHETDDCGISVNGSIHCLVYERMIFILLDNLPVDSMPESVIAGVHDDRPKSDRQRKETLRHGCVPHLVV